MAIQHTDEESVLAELRSLLGGIYPNDRLKEAAPVIARVNRLKEEKNALILGHNYMEPLVYATVSDLTGDSLGLCREAARSEADIILFAGVHFMAETAAILNPERKVLIPAEGAGCSLADGIRPEDIRELRSRFPGVPVITYINTTAALKAECDICCTSGNAEAVVSQLLADNDQVIFVPDANLALNTARKLGLESTFPLERLEDGSYVFTDSDSVASSPVIGWRGSCEVHIKFKLAMIEQARRDYQSLAVIVHPESPPEVVAAADFAGSTSRMDEFITGSNAEHFLVVTESAMTDNLRVAHPDRHFLPVRDFRCPYMEKTGLEDILAALEEERYVVAVSPDLREQALKAVEKMLAIG